MTDFKKIFQQFAKENKLTTDSTQNLMVGNLAKMYELLVKPTKKSFLSFGGSKTIKGMYIWGGVGRGKTMIMDLFFENLPIKEKLRVHFNIFMLDVHNSVKLLREAGQGKDPLKSIAKEISEKCRILCFDEFQVYDIADAMVLSELFKFLFIEGVTVIATSNVAPDDLYKDGLQRSRFLPFIPLVKKHMNVLHLDGLVDYRQQALREDGVYFIQTENKMKNLFKKLTFPHLSSPDTIDVKGRKIPIEHAIDGVAWVSFAELCEQPRAAADYNELSKKYHTIFLNNVPKMGYDRRNEAKRFILLIDTIYDAGVKLIVNAHATPFNLYSGDDHAFEFDRTISRLLEMQSIEYLTKTNADKIGKNKA